MLSFVMSLTSRQNLLATAIAARSKRSQCPASGTKSGSPSSGMVPLLLPRLRHFHHQQRRSLKMSSEPIFKQQFGNKLHHLTPLTPNVDPQEYGYIRDESSKTLLPTTVPDSIPLAPESVMKLIKCNCSGEGPCRTMRCSCSHSKLPCTLFCNCGATNECLNELTKAATSE